MTVRWMVGGGCIALAALYTVSLAFWWPRAGELASIVMSASSHWAHWLLALNLVADALLVAPSAFVGFRCIAGDGRRKLVLSVVGLGLLASIGPFVNYLVSALPLYFGEGQWLRYGSQIDLGVGLAMATLALQLAVRVHSSPCLRGSNSNASCLALEAAARHWSP
jgi:hypothetical protein